MPERLQKIIAQAGVTSRRHAEQMILEGRVAVNGEVVSKLGTRAEVGRDHIRVDGRRLAGPAAPRYWLFNKPRRVVTTMRDPEGRPCIGDITRKMEQRLFPVGRLDFMSEGLLLLTNDGALADRVLRASTGLPKTYWAKVAGRPKPEALDKLRRGIYIDGRRTAPAQIRWLPPGGRARRQAGVYRPSEENPWLEIVLIEGRHHQVRKMFAAVGHPVEKLKRVAIGHIQVGSLRPGTLRPLTPAEVVALRRATAPRTTPSPRATSPRPAHA